MPIKRPFWLRLIDRSHAISSVLILPFIALLPLRWRRKIMTSCASFFWPLVRSMLVPATQRDPHKAKPLQLAGSDLESIEATILFGGNDCLRNEVAPLVDGVSFFDGTVFHTKKRPLLLMPLIEAHTEEQYIDRIYDYVMDFLKKFKKLKKVYIIGHSLGAAITIQLAAKMRRCAPASWEYNLALDRSFSSLSEVAIYLYPLSGWVMSRTLGIIWKFESALTLKKMAADKKVFCHIYQITPDHVIGTAELLQRLRFFFEGRSWPERWSYRSLDWPQNNNAHILPFEEAFCLQSTRKADAQECAMDDSSEGRSQPAE